MLVSQKSRVASPMYTFSSMHHFVCLTVLFSLKLASAGFSESQLELPWQQYYQGHYNYWKLPNTGRPERFRVGRGRYRITHKGADIDCEFPPSAHILSNIIWERADLGSSGNLDAMYKLLGETKGYSVTGRPKGSTLQLFGQSPLDKGLYRCIATALDPFSGRSVTIFQDVIFFPNFRFGFGSKEYKPCCTTNDFHRDYHYDPYLRKPSIYFH